MPSLRPIHHSKFQKFLVYVGCQLVRTKGSHFIYHRVGLNRPVVIPAKGELPVFVILNNLKLLNISKEKYLEIMESL